jgi:hypothetical protein
MWPWDLYSVKSMVESHISSIRCFQFASIFANPDISFHVSVVFNLDTNGKRRHWFPQQKRSTFAGASIRNEFYSFQIINAVLHTVTKYDHFLGNSLVNTA